ncbi:FAD-dependent oxidoreductase [Spirochaeta cellobiosiphila]|uniref:FAD-dependent oxidoreductase n=1 Tax=Spirochaeta cellobiosiphila TaxID=504483 RepID=UPI0003F55F2B|nr:FAD-dependent oxidoreductase [Spirochaeta cellobiosiphila]
MKYVIVGGVAGGATTAARLRRNDENAEIILLEKGEYISYANCGLPYYLGQVITDRERLFVQDPQSFNAMLNVTVKINSEVIKVVPAEKKVIVRNLLTQEEYNESYDKLVLSPGANPVIPPIPGIRDDKIFTVRNVVDTDAVTEYIKVNSPKHAVIVGAGFIGLEMAENLHSRGMKVTIVEMSEQVMTMLDYEMAALVHQHLKTMGIEFYLKDGVSSFNSKGDLIDVNLASGRSISADLVILSIGVKPDAKLAIESGIEIGNRGGIVVNKYLQTNNKDIYAVGDAIEYPNPITGLPTLANLAGPANKQGRICADNIVYGEHKEYIGSIGTAVAKIFELTVASTGCSEKQLQRDRIEYQCCHTHSSSHAGYYPGAMPLSVKLLFSPVDHRVLGAQIVGYKGVDKRIDMIATTILHKGTIESLEEIEHAYAPPYSSAKDPVNIAGFVAENLLNNRTHHISWKELLKENSEQIFLVDVRLPDEFHLGSINGAINIPLQQVRDRISEFPVDKKIILFCGVGLRAYMAERILIGHNFTNVYNLDGGMKTYEHAVSKQSNEDIYANDYIDKDDHIYQKESPKIPSIDTATIEIDACGLQCPGPIMKLKENLDKLTAEQTLKEKANDPGFEKDVVSWCKMTGNELVNLDKENGIITAVIKKKEQQTKEPAHFVKTGGTNTTLIVFSDDFDKALASFVIANGAAASGKEVTMFFTFWGLNVIKKYKKVKTKKTLISKMFGIMLPKNSKKLSLSSMNMGGMGTNLMRGIMKRQKIDSLEQMIQNAMTNKIKFVACQMSMDVMGVDKAELLDGVEVGGVATMLEKADTSAGTFFI